jgi:hypothetical protein
VYKYKYHSNSHGQPIQAFGDTGDWIKRTEGVVLAGTLALGEKAEAPATKRREIAVVNFMVIQWTSVRRR